MVHFDEDELFTANTDSSTYEWGVNPGGIIGKWWRFYQFIFMVHYSVLTIISKVKNNEILII